MKPYGIFTINPDGSDLTLILAADTDSRIGEFAWSPDGTKIAFYCDEYGGICSMNPDGSDLTIIATFNAVGPPVWSPDGTKMLLRRDRSDPSLPGQPLLYTVNADGTDLDPLFPNGSSPDRSDLWFGAYGGWQPLPSPPGPKSQAECKENGYKNFGFDHQGRCIASVQRAAKSK